MKNIGIVIIILGIVMIIYTGFDIVTHKNVVDLGPIQINKTENHPIRWSPIVGGILLISGIVIVLTNKNK